MHRKETAVASWIHDKLILNKNTRYKTNAKWMHTLVSYISLDATPLVNSHRDYKNIADTVVSHWFVLPQCLKIFLLNPVPMGILKFPHDRHIALPAQKHDYSIQHFCSLDLRSIIIQAEIFACQSYTNEHQQDDLQLHRTNWTMKRKTKCP